MDFLYICIAFVVGDIVGAFTMFYNHRAKEKLADRLHASDVNAARAEAYKRGYDEASNNRHNVLRSHQKIFGDV